MPLQTLLTGFGPFGNVADNPTARLLNHFAARTVPGHEVTICALPTSFARATDLFRSALEAGGRNQAPFDLVFMLGVAAGSDVWRVETQGLNWDAPGIPDVDGFATPGRKIVPNGAAQVSVTIAPSPLAQAIEAVGAPVVLSNSAGAYLCNHLLYFALHHLQTTGHAARAGFLHVPADDQTYAPNFTPKPGSVFLFGQHIEVVQAVLSHFAKYGAI